LIVSELIASPGTQAELPLPATPTKLAKHSPQVFFVSPQLTLFKAAQSGTWEQSTAFKKEDITEMVCFMTSRLLLDADSCEPNTSDKALVDISKADTITAEVDEVKALKESKTLATQTTAPPGNGEEPKAASDRPLTTLKEEVDGSVYENSYDRGRSSSTHRSVEYTKRVFKATPPVGGSTEKKPEVGGVFITTEMDACVDPAVRVKT
jgi:hypothetical protein